MKARLASSLHSLEKTMRLLSVPRRRTSDSAMAPLAFGPKAPKASTATTPTATPNTAASPATAAAAAQPATATPAAPAAARQQHVRPQLMKGERAQRRHVDLRLQVLPLLEHHLLRLLFCIEDLVGLVEQPHAIDVRFLEDTLVGRPLAHVEDRELGLEDRIVEYLLEVVFWKRSTRCELSASITSILSVLSALRPDSPSSSWHVRRQSAPSVLIDEAPELGLPKYEYEKHRAPVKAATSAAASAAEE
jgi:hypothetical protein